jgi:hypothetical protein
VLAVVLVMVLRRSNGNGGKVVVPQDQAAYYFQLTAIAQDVKELSRDLSRYASAAENAARDRHDVLVRGLELMNDRIVDHQQAVERRLPAA